MGKIQAICISAEKGTVKRPVKSAELQVGWGIKGDAHAGKWHRQVSLLAGERIDTMKALFPSIEDGAFAENLVTRGLDLRAIPVGGRLNIGGDILLEITQIGKECHQGCAIRKLTGDCIMPREGLFARVLSGGIVHTGDSVRMVKTECKESTISAVKATTNADF